MLPTGLSTPNKHSETIPSQSYFSFSWKKAALLTGIGVATIYSLSQVLTSSDDENSTSTALAARQVGAIASVAQVLMKGLPFVLAAPVEQDIEFENLVIFKDPKSEELRKLFWDGKVLKIPYWGDFPCETDQSRIFDFKDAEDKDEKVRKGVEIYKRAGEILASEDVVDPRVYQTECFMSHACPPEARQKFAAAHSFFLAGRLLRQWDEKADPSELFRKAYDTMKEINLSDFPALDAAFLQKRIAQIADFFHDGTCVSEIEKAVARYEEVVKLNPDSMHEFRLEQAKMLHHAAILTEYPKVKYIYYLKARDLLEEAWEKSPDLLKGMPSFYLDPKQTFEIKYFGHTWLHHLRERVEETAPSKWTFLSDLIT